ncbi:nitrate reductase molybdenum cofactor assembly chaperone [Streptacidiphilus monticola]|uniref:Nitrate reductase molybdenum cofactor assembly chaperone n=1 Tax=Streptacidiphilus monticola TaxID=2161674 RepID=A0ABW1G8H6_9ACTN
MTRSARGRRADAATAVRYRAAVRHQAAARCLGYPDAELLDQLPLLRAAVGDEDPLGRFLDHAGVTPLSELAAHYTEVFDFRNRHSLHLSWWTDGDTRRRGTALLRFTQVYREHGLRLQGEELPDFLPVVLEFSAATRSDALLREHRPGLELLRLALEEAATPYAHVLTSVCATLPGASPADRAQALALARSGPPREDVGTGGELPPYGHLAQLPVLTGGR